MIKPLDASKNDDFFSLGLIVLMIIVKGKPEDFYHWHKTEKIFVGSVNLKHIEYCMRMLMRNYSTKLVAKVKELLYQGNRYEVKEEE